MSEWVNAYKRMPDTTGRYIAACSSAVSEVYFDKARNTFYSRRHEGDLIEPTHWMPLPAPPPRESSFEAWWRSLPIVACGDTEARYVAAKERVTERAARAVWRAASACAKDRDDAARESE